MKGLLLKDWYMILKYEKLYPVFIAVYAVLAAYSPRSVIVFILINVLLGSMTVKTLMAYEEQNKWDSLAVNLPLSKGLLVFEKYLVGFFGVIFANVMTFLIIGLLRPLAKGAMELPLLPLFVLYIALGALYLAVQLPLLFKFGTVRGKVIQIGGIGIAALISGVVSTFLVEKMPAPGVPAQMTWPMIGGIYIIVALGIFVSVKLSVSFYRKREF